MAEPVYPFDPIEYGGDKTDTCSLFLNARNLKVTDPGLDPTDERRILPSEVKQFITDTAIQIDLTVHSDTEEPVRYSYSKDLSGPRTPEQPRIKPESSSVKYSDGFITITLHKLPSEKGSQKKDKTWSAKTIEYLQEKVWPE